MSFAAVTNFLLFTKAGRGLVIAGVFVLLVIAFWNEAQQRVIDDIEDENNEAITNADAAEIGFTRCRDAGGVWDFTPPGKCTGLD